MERTLIFKVGDSEVKVDSDMAHLADYSWSLHETKPGQYYARRLVGNSRKKSACVYLHHEVIGKPPKGHVVDHINGDKLDCRKENLRVVTYSQNNQNMRSGGGSSQYKGVSLEKASGRWYASIRVSGKSKSLGRWGTEAEAARAYDVAASKAFGEFARLNFPGGSV